MGPIATPVLDVAWLPDQPSEPVPPVGVHVVALVADHFNVNELFGGIWAVVELLADIVTTGAPGGAGVTVTLTELGPLEPPEPIHARVYV
jgi:hypothetical protein